MSDLDGLIMESHLPNSSQDKANPLAMVLSVAMLLNYGLGETKAAESVEQAVFATLDKGFRTGDISSPGKVAILRP